MPAATSTLATIEQKVRRITRSPSVNQLSQNDLEQYINTFIAYEIPSNLRLFNLRQTLTFYTSPNIDTYSTNTTVTTDPLYNFKNKYITVHEPAYIAGYPALFSQSREQFFGIYPIVNNIQSIGTSGDGVTVTFSGFINQLNSTIASGSNNIPVLQNMVTFSSLDGNNNGLCMVDVPFSSNLGSLVIPNQPAPAFPSINNFIDYITGQFTVTFNTPPAAGAVINTETVPYVAALPQALCYFNDSFILRPVPDQCYPVNIEVYIRPTQLLASNESPDLEQWWQYIAYGASRLIFADRMDMDSLAQIQPLFKEQESMVLRTTIVQLTKQRVGTIYTENTGMGSGVTGWSWGGTGNF